MDYGWCGLERSEVLFWVADTGRGIAPESLPRVFDRFWQAIPGAGRFGLAIARGIVETHRGRTWVESTAGRGSTLPPPLQPETAHTSLSSEGNRSTQLAVPANLAPMS